MASSSWLRVAVVQFAPKLGEVHANIATARRLCRGLTPRSVDLVCFPEMVFTGYMFPDAPSIAPFLEHPRTGPTASFCTELARRLGCVVVAGFPERLPGGASASVAGAGAGTRPPSPGALVGANAALVCDATGRVVHTYRKSNLFPVDLTWARPGGGGGGGGAGFAAVDLPAPLGRTAVAICNDLNVRAGETWETIERGPYELAEWCRRERVRVLVLLNAWLRPEDGGMEGVEEDGGNADAVGAHVGGEARPQDNNDGAGAGEDDEADDDQAAEEGREDGLEPNWRVLNYWATRLRPLWAADAARTDAEEGTRQHETAHAPNEQQDVIVVVCNRFGRERGKTFAGSSAMFAMRPGSGRPRLLQAMGEREEGVHVWTARIGSQTLSSCSSS